MSRQPRFSSAASLIACLVAGSMAPRMQASGFQLREQSPRAQGTAFAGVSAGGEDASAIFFNPAGMTRFQDSQTSIGFSYVAPVAKFSDADWETLAGLLLDAMGRVPKVGDEVTIDGWRARVLEMDGQRVARVELRAPGAEKETQD